MRAPSATYSPCNGVFRGGSPRVSGSGMDLGSPKDNARSLRPVRAPSVINLRDFPQARARSFGPERFRGGYAFGAGFVQAGEADLLRGDQRRASHRESRDEVNGLRSRERLNGGPNRALRNGAAHPSPACEDGLVDPDTLAGTALPRRRPYG